MWRSPCLSDLKWKKSSLCYTGLNIFDTVSQLCTLCVFLFHKVCLHNEEPSPGVLILPSPKPERLGSVFVSSSLLVDSGFVEEDDDRESKWRELHDESYVSFCFSPVPVQTREEKLFWGFQITLILQEGIRIWIRIQLGTLWAILHV